MLVFIYHSAAEVVDISSSNPVHQAFSQTESSETAAPLDVLNKALNSLIGIMAYDEEIQYRKMQSFNECFLNPRIKQKVFLSLVLPQITKYQILKETVTPAGKNLEVNVTLQTGTKKLIFNFIYRKKQWWISDIQ